MCTCCFCDEKLKGNAEIEREDKFGNAFCCAECAMDYYHLTPMFNVDFNSAMNILFEDFYLHPFANEA